MADPGEKKQGLAILETLIVSVIMFVLAAFSYISLVSFRDQQILNNGVGSALALIQDARSRTLASRYNAQYGINFQTDRLILFQGASYPGLTIEEMPLDAHLQIIEVQLQGGGTSLIFERLSGTTFNEGTLQIGIKDSQTASSTLRINAAGLVSVE